MNSDEMEEKASELLFSPVHGIDLPAPVHMIDMSDVFVEQPISVPPFNGETSFVDFVKQVEEFPFMKVVARMSELNYPNWYIRRFEKMCLNGTLDTTVKRLENIKKQMQRPTLRQSKSRGPGGREAEQGKKGSGRTVFWRIPLTKVSRVPKPTTYNKRSFRRWVLGEAAELATSLTYKTSYVTGNLSCETLYWFRGNPGAAADRLLQTACVFVESYKFLPGRVPPAITLENFLRVPLDDVRTLNVHGVTYCAATSSLKDVLGPKNSLFFNLAVCYFTDVPYKGKTVDKAYLQGKLTTLFPPPVVPVAAPEPLVFSPSYETYVPIATGFSDRARNLEGANFAIHRLPAHVHSPRLGKPWRPYEYVWVRPPGLPFDVVPIEWKKRLSRREHRRSRIDKEVLTLQGASSSKIAGDIGDTVAMEFMSRHERDFASLAALFAALYVGDSWKSKALALLQFVASNDYLYKKLKLSILVYQGDGDDGPGMDDPAGSGWFHGLFRQVWETAVASASFICIKSLFADAAEYFASPIYDFIKGDLKVTFLKSMAISISQSIIDAIKEVLSRVSACFKQKSFSPMWGAAWDPVVWAKFATSMIAHQSVLVRVGDVGASKDDELAVLREKGSIPPDWVVAVSIEEYVDRLSEHVDQGRKLIRYFRDSALVRASISRCIGLLEQHITTQEISRYAGNYRIKPFGLVFYGVPGQGKTNLAETVFRAIAERKKWDATSSGQYSWVQNANFQTGLRRQWSVVLNDIDHGVAPPQSGMDTHIQTFTKLVDNAPYPVEESESSLKGSTYANPMLVTYITNFYNCRVKGNTAAPRAFWRRINMHVEVFLKPEFARADGTGDTTKMIDSDTHDMYVILVRHYSREVQGDVPLSAARRFTLPEFMVYFFEKFDEHLHNEDLMRDRRSYSGPFCRTCFLPSNKDCGHEITLQGAKVSVPVSSELEEESPQPSEDDITRELSWGEWLQMRPSCRRTSAVATLRETTELLRRAVSGFSKAFFVKGALVITALAACSVTITKVYLQARESNSSGETPPTWLRASTDYKAGLPPNPARATFTKEQLAANLATCFVAVKGPVYSVNAVAIAHNAILTTTHVLFDKGQLAPKVQIKFRDVTRDVAVSDLTYKVLPTCKELCVLVAHELQLTGCLGNYPYAEWDLGISQFDEVELWGTSFEQKAITNSVGSAHGNRCVTAVFPHATIDGDCGKLYVARFGTSWRPVAMHYALLTTHSIGGVSNRSMGGTFSRSDLKLALQSVGCVYQGLSTCKGFLTLADTFQITHYPQVSEVDAVRRQGLSPVPCGTLHPPLAGGTMKTKVTKSLIHDDFFPLTQKWCGTSEPYWTLPKFKGKMVDDKWTSPYTNAFVPQNTRTPDEKYMWLALADYVTGISALDCDGYRALSEEETLSGLPGTSIHSFEVRTSVGPPFNRAKTNFMLLKPGESYMHEKLWGCIDEVEEILLDGDVPAAVGLCIPKDEALKVGKFPRIFINLPFAINFHLKQKFGAGICFVRNNKFFFECMVGVNMTSLEANDVVSHLARVDPTLENVADADAVAMDKSWSGVLFDFVALAIWVIAHFLRIHPFEVLSLVVGLKHCRYIIKNDIFCAMWNPSGNWITVLLNGILVSLGERYIYYRTRPSLFSDSEVSAYVTKFFSEPEWFDSRLDFRSRVALVTYGDDSLKSTNIPIPKDYLVIWKEELGLTVTDGLKTGVMTVGPISDSSFLKRRLVLDEELGLYIARLSQKSMSRTLLMKKESSLTMPDHAATAMSEVMREMVYYGEHAYERFRAMCDSVAAKHHLLSNSNYVSRPYTYWREEMKSGHYSAWSFDVQSNYVDSVWVPQRTGGRFTWVQVPGPQDEEL